jgi:hypothetical protein
MRQLRQWQLGAAAPYALQLAADARLCRTDYTDDQVWELALGDGDNPALALQTRYGGRVGLASLVPMWEYDGRSIYQARVYARPPVIIAFAPGYLKARAALTPELALTAEYITFESHAVGGRFTVSNTGGETHALRFDLFGHVGAQKKDQPLAILSLRDGSNALSLGRYDRLEAVVVLDNASVSAFSGGKPSPKIGTELTIPAGESVAVRWVHAGVERMRASLERAQFWMSQDWDALLAQVAAFAQAIPVIETGNTDHDAVIAFSYQQLVQAFLRPTESLPHSSFVANRQPERGFSPRGDGSDYDRGWSGQTPQIAYLAALGIAPIAPELAQGIVRNYLAAQAEDGWIDARPGLGGQGQGILCPPLLARIAWEIYLYTEDDIFLAEVFPGLVRFFSRWCEVDLDADRDALPEWQDERQTGYIFWPTFAAGQPWAQNASLHHVETPDMGAYLVSEAHSLREIAQVLGDPGGYEIHRHLVNLQKLLDDLWYEPEARYAYRDRDTHVTTNAISVIQDGRGDEEQIAALALDPPARLLIRVSGGAGKPPRASLYLEGLGADGSTIHETADLSDFAWGYASGVYTTHEVFAAIDRVRLQGLSRVYRVDVSTIDLTRLDINALMPLWSPETPPERAEPLIRYLIDESHFWRQGGLSIVSAQDKNYDPSSANGGGGCWSYWLTLLGEGLSARGQVELAGTMLKRHLNAQVEVLKRQKCFSEFYHSDEPVGLGEAGYLSGIVPVHLLMVLLGVRIVSSDRVWTGGKFGWGAPVEICQHGVIVQRSNTGTRVEFPSGHVVALPADAEWQAVIDPEPVTRDAFLSTTQPISPEVMPPIATSRVIIEVDQDTDSDA